MASLQQTGLACRTITKLQEQYQKLENKLIFPTKGCSDSRKKKKVQNLIDFIKKKYLNRCGIKSFQESPSCGLSKTDYNKFKKPPGS
uniref:Uncharacterized protein n=1 Tax=Rhizophora mucronata TaxID=61149 RepID=A0A2P2NG82_RHIMU